MTACAARWIFLAASCGGVLLLAGCESTPTAIAPPPLDPAAAAAEAMKAYDTNGDGKIAGEELEKVPAFKKHLAEYDTDKDGGVNAKEIQERIVFFRKSETGLMSFHCFLTLDGQPLKDAQVELIPEPFLGPGILKAAGTSQESGMVTFSVPADKLPPGVPKGGSYVHAGIYKLSVTHPQVPAKYTGEKTILGYEVSPPHSQESAKFELSSK